MGKLEKNAQIAFKDALGRLRSGTYTPAEFAQRLERDVLPRWTTIQENFQRDRVPDKSKLKPPWELIADYSDTRLEAQNELELGQMDLKLIKDLDKSK